MTANPLEATALGVQAGTATVTELVDAFLAAQVLVPSATDPAKEGVTPILVDVGPQQHMVVATSRVALEPSQHVAQFAVAVTGTQVIEGLIAGAGVMVQTPDKAFNFAPEVVAEIRVRKGIAQR